MNKFVLLLLIALMAVQINAMPADAKDPAKGAKDAAGKGADAAKGAEAKAAADAKKPEGAAKGAEKGGGMGKEMEKVVDGTAKEMDSFLDMW